MNLINAKRTLDQLEENQWLFFESGRDFANEITGVKLSDQKIFVQFIGGDFEKPTIIWFDFSQEAFNEMWQYEFREDYRYSLSYNSFSLWGINDIAATCYTMLNDLNYTCKHMGMVESDVE